MPSINLGKVVGTVDENTPITFEDYTSTTAPEPEEALSKITSPNTIGNLFKYIKGFLNNVIHKNNITNSVDTNDSTKIPSSVVTYSLNETKVDKTAIVHNTEVDDATKIPGMDLINNLNTRIVNLSKMTTDEYNATKTYKFGDYCIKNNVLYKCNTDIETAEAWTESHWRATTISSEMISLNNNLENHFMSGFVATSFDLDFTNSKNTMHYIFTQFEIIAVARYSSSVSTYKLVTSTMRPLTITVDGFNVHMESPNGSVWLSMISIRV